MLNRFKKLHFQPLPGLASCHLQMIVASFLPPGPAPSSEKCLIDLDGGDRLCCEISTPPNWTQNTPTVVLIHGMGGSHCSTYMIRMARKLFAKGIKAVRVNLKGCGSGKGLSKLPYNAGSSGDVLKVLQFLKRKSSNSEIVLMGFSLGGNIALKLAGELGARAAEFVKKFIAICAPLDLSLCVQNIIAKRNRFYHAYYLNRVSKQGKAWLPRKMRTLYEFDDLVTAPLGGFKGADEYYEACSSIRFLPKIRQTTHLLFAQDDPFVNLDQFQVALPDPVTVWATERGGHMGFLGKTSDGPYWMDQKLLNWLDDFSFS